MPLDPQAEQFLSELAALGAPPPETLSPAEARQQMEQGSAGLRALQEITAIENSQIPGPPSHPGSIPIRIYQHGSFQEPPPIIVYFHGGGWVIGSIKTHDALCRNLAAMSRAIVISVDYRLAPEHRFPAAMEDAYAATQWAAQNADTLGGDRSRVFAAGDSAGGNLAAAAAIACRKRGGPQLAGQVLIYPITDYDLDTPSYTEFAEGHYLSRSAMQWFWDQYVPNLEQRSDWCVSVLREKDLSGLPPALVILAECDPLRDEGEAYAKRLTGAGVPVQKRMYDGMLHGFVRRTDRFPQATKALEEIAAFTLLSRAR